MKKLNLLFIVLSVFVIVSCNHNAANSENEKKSETTTSETLYSLTVTAAANGKITPNKTSEIRAGEEIVLIVEPNEGYKLKTLTVVTEKQKDIAVAAISRGTVYKFTMPIGNVTVNSEFVINTVTEDLTDPQADGAVLYKIEHWLQDVDDLETYELAVVQTKSGEAGEETTAAAKTYTGFNTVPFNQKIISENGNTVVKIFYNRKIITYTFDPNGGNWDGDTSSKIVTGVYGTAVTNIPQNPFRNGCTFNSWDKTIPDMFGLDDITFKPVWNILESIKYTVKIYKQNIWGGNSYTLSSSEEHYGMKGFLTDYLAPDITGFDVLDYSQINIADDGSSVLNVYYNRKSYTVTFDTNGGSSIPSQQVLYEGNVIKPNNPKKDNYMFLNWYTSSNCETSYNFSTLVEGPITLYAGWRVYDFNYTFHETVTKLTVGTDGTAGTDAEYVLFGDYPQSIKDDAIEINENIEGYFGENRLFSGSDNNLYVEENGVYYKVEPIKWRVLSKDVNGKAVLLAEKILQQTVFWGTSYNDSYIREYLHDYFLNEAFTGNAIELIQTTTVQSDSYITYNSAPDIPVLTDSTQDKIYFLSASEISDISVFVNDASRIRTNTDYALIHSYYPNDEAAWWLRSTDYHESDNFIMSYCITNSGKVNYDDVYGIGFGGYAGVVPAITVYLPD